MRSVKRVPAGLAGAICVVLLTGCGQLAAANAGTSSPTPSAAPRQSPSTSMAPSQFLNCLEPGHDYNAPASQPVPQRVTVDRACGQDRLEAVPTSVIPKVSGAAAYARCDRCDKSSNLSEELAYYSAATPATMPAGCEPVPNVPMPAVCNGPGTPVYDHRLVWFFVGKSNCSLLGGLLGPNPAAKRSPVPLRSFPCVWFAPMDASNDTVDFTTSG
jgi:hypothetical protein